jgi:mRNA interferase MazF
VLLSFPFTDQSGSKRRPAIVLSTDEYNRRCLDLIVAPITCNLGTGQTDDTPLTDWNSAGQLRPSVVKGVVGTVQQSLVRPVLGVATAAERSPRPLQPL